MRADPALQTRLLRPDEGRHSGPARACMPDLRAELPCVILTGVHNKTS
jgi:hypothetical protein